MNRFSAPSTFGLGGGVVYGVPKRRYPEPMSDPRRRIEALRAKAESTTFPAEAEALLAKATELEAALPPEPERISGTNWMEQMILDSLRASGRITVSGNTFIPHGTTIYITWS